MVDEVTPEEVNQKIGSSAVQVVDIRHAIDFHKGHIPGAINIPFYELPQRIVDYEWEDDIVVVCPVGKSSIQAARLIESYEGVTADASVASMAGGYEKWEYELERTKENDT